VIFDGDSGQNVSFSSRASLMYQISVFNRINIVVIRTRSTVTATTKKQLLFRFQSYKPKRKSIFFLIFEKHRTVFLQRYFSLFKKIWIRIYYRLSCKCRFFETLRLACLKKSVIFLGCRLFYVSITDKKLYE
jgi:hypothetical protein